MRDKPVPYMITLASTGLQEEAPIETSNTTYEDTPTMLEIPKAKPEDQLLFAQLTARLDATLSGKSLSLDGSTWIWYPEGDPRSSAPAGTRYFRYEFDLPSGMSVASAKLLFTVDNAATVFINGQTVGSSDNWKTARVREVADTLQTGTNAIAIEAVNTLYRGGPSPAGAICRLKVTTERGETIVVNTNGNWSAATEAASGWKSVGFDDSNWVAVRELGKYGTGPWGRGVSTEPANPSEGYARIELAENSEVVHTDPVTITPDEGNNIRSTEWKEVPDQARGGRATLQVKSSDGDTTTRVTAVTLKIAVRAFDDEDGEDEDKED